MAVDESTITESDSPPLERPQLNLQLLEEAEDAYKRDLTYLLEHWEHYWVAYHGKERLGISYYPKRLRRRFALPPDGRLSIWERWFGRMHERYSRRDLSFYFIDSTLLCNDVEIESQVWLDEATPPASTSRDDKPISA